jgi:hypothetical protein
MKNKIKVLKDLFFFYLKRSTYSVNKDPLKNIKKENLSYKDSWGNTLFHLAVIFNDKKALGNLNHSSLDPHKKNVFGFSPFLLAKYLYPETLFLELFPEEESSNPILVKKNSEETKLLDKKNIKKELGFIPLRNLKFENYNLLCLSSYHHLKSFPNSEKYQNSFFLQVYKEQIENPFPLTTYLKFIDKKIGYGLFISKDIPQGGFLGEYTGQVRKSSLFPSFNSFLFSYSLKELSKTCVDAKFFGNSMRFINHSYRPNVKCIKYFFENVLHIYVLAQKPIKKDEQLFMDYGSSFWTFRSPSSLD